MNTTNLKQLVIGLVVLGMVLGACSAEPSATLPAEPIPSETFIAPISTSTDTPAFAPTVTFTTTPMPHPMSIQALRDGNFPGSDIVIESELDRGANYRRFYAYYLSEGLKIYALLTVPDGDPPEGGFPAIVFNHGYIPPDIYKTTERYIAYVDQIARAGYIVFRIDYRGHDN
jgi:hypothetical protein